LSRDADTEPKHQALRAEARVPNLDETASRDMSERIVAIGLLTQRDLSLLGPTFDRVWPVEEAPAFDDLIRAVDEADRKLRKSEPTYS
jgi:hypothetical protein